MSQYKNDRIQNCHPYDDAINRCIVNKLCQKTDLLLFHIQVTDMHNLMTISQIEQNTKIDLLFDHYLPAVARCISPVCKLEINGSIIIDTCNDTICCFDK